MNDKMIKIIQGDITTLVVDAIVNVANQVMLGGGGVDIRPRRRRRVARRSVATEPRSGRKRSSAIHRAAEALDVSRNTVRKYL